MAEQHVQAGPTGLCLCVCSWNPEAAGVPLVVLHGFLEQGAAWDAVARRLGDRRVYAPDHRGHGRSEHVGRGGFYHFWDYVADLDGLLVALFGNRDDAPRRVDLVGHSMGGTVACLFAATRPERVRRLVLVEGLGPPDMTSLRLAQARTSLDHRRAPPRHRGLASVADAAGRMRRWNAALDEPTAQRLARRVTRPTRPDDPAVDPAHPGPLVWTWDPLHRARSPRAFEAATFLTFLGAITAPTLAVTGGRSRFRPPDIEERLARVARAEHLVIRDAGHLVHHDAPGALADAIRAHCRSG